MKKTIVILGAGPGIGQAVAKKFGDNNFNVILIGRNEEKITALAGELKKSRVAAKVFSGDVTDVASIKDVFQKVVHEFGSLDVVHYNAAAVSFKNILNESADSLTQDFKVNVAGLQSAALSAMENLAASSGAILVTGGGFALYPYPDFGSLSIGKAGIRNLAGSLHQSLKDKNIFVGTVTVKGLVSPEAEIHNPANIAEHFWKLYSERNEFEIQL